MKSDKYLSRLQFFVSQLISIFVFVILPLVLKNTANDEIKINTIRTLWKESHLVLPVPTHYAIYFTDNTTLRIIILVLFLIVGLFMEFFLNDKKIREHITWFVY